MHTCQNECALMSARLYIYVYLHMYSYDDMQTCTSNTHANVRIRACIDMRMNTNKYVCTYTCTYAMNM